MFKLNLLSLVCGKANVITSAAGTIEPGLS